MPETVGQQLKKARLERHLSLEQVFESTHIRVSYLEALEADDFYAMPSPVQGRGFLRLYAQHLALDIEHLLEELRQTENSFSSNEVFKVTDAGDEIVEQEIVIADVDAASLQLDANESFWAPLLRRIGITLASPQPAPVEEAESAPETVAAPITMADALAKPEDVQHEPSASPDGSLIAFAKIGAILRERREMLSLTYGEVDQHIHVREHYLRALEAGEFASLPSPVQARGILSNYATFLDLDADSLLLRFADGLQAQRKERYVDEEPGQRRKKGSALPWQRFVAPDLFFGIGMIVLLIGFSVWGIGRIVASRSEIQLGATAPSISEVLLVTPTFVATKEATPTFIVNTPDSNIATEFAPLDENLIGVQVFITVVERTWMRVSVDGEIVFEGRVQSGGDFFYEGEEQVEILAGNAAALRVTYNQRDLGLLGSFGEVVSRIYAVEGILTPTITPTPTIAETPRTTPSPTMTPSPIPTNVLLED